jgi:hypothetical protein
MLLQLLRLVHFPSRLFTGHRSLPLKSEVGFGPLPDRKTCADVLRHQKLWQFLVTDLDHHVGRLVME